MGGVSIELFWPYCILAALLFVIGVYCMLVSANLVRILVGLEILIKAVTLVLILAGFATHREALAQALVITLIVIEVVIMVVAGGVILCVFRHHGDIESNRLKELKG